MARWHEHSEIIGDFSDPQFVAGWTAAEDNARLRMEDSREHYLSKEIELKSELILSQARESRYEDTISALTRIIHRKDLDLIKSEDRVRLWVYLSSVLAFVVLFLGLYIGGFFG